MSCPGDCAFRRRAASSSVIQRQIGTAGTAQVVATISQSAPVSIINVNVAIEKAAHVQRARSYDRHSVAMVATLLTAWCLLAVTVTIHATGLTTMLRRVSRLHRAQFWPMTPLLVWVAGWLLLLHLAEISVWALFYWWQMCLPDAESSFYFSGVTYTTLGYGDLVLPREWRLLGPIEGLTGILMSGLSTGFFFAVLSKLLAAQSSSEQD
jgi:hypothetical protein